MQLQQWSGSNILCGEIKYLICRPNQVWLQCSFEFDFWYLTQTPKTSILQRAAAQSYCINTNSNPQPWTTKSSSMFSCSATTMINQTRVCKGLTKKGWDVSLTSWWNIMKWRSLLEKQWQSVWEEVHGTCWPEYTFLTAATASTLDSSCDSCDTTGNPASCHFGKPPLRTHTFSWPKTLNILHTTKYILAHSVYSTS